MNIWSDRPRASAVASFPSPLHLSLHTPVACLIHLATRPRPRAGVAELILSGDGQRYTLKRGAVLLWCVVSIPVMCPVSCVATVLCHRVCVCVCVCVRARVRRVRVCVCVCARAMKHLFSADSHNSANIPRIIVTRKLKCSNRVQLLTEVYKRLHRQVSESRGYKSPCGTLR